MPLNHRGNLHLLATFIGLAEEAQSQLFVGYLERLLFSATKDCHGTLIVVTPARHDHGLPNALNDAVNLKPPLDLYERFQLHLEEGKTATSVSRLQTASELVTGFIRSDGITVFNTSGKVLCYRAFVHSNAPNKPSSGGARSRAYKVLIEMVNEGELLAAFFKSHDGRTEIYQHIKGEKDE